MTRHSEGDRSWRKHLFSRVSGDADITYRMKRYNFVTIVTIQAKTVIMITDQLQIVLIINNYKLDYMI